MCGDFGVRLRVHCRRPRVRVLVSFGLGLVLVLGLGLVLVLGLGFVLGLGLGFVSRTFE